MAASVTVMSRDPRTVLEERLRHDSQGFVALFAGADPLLEATISMRE